MNVSRIVSLVAAIAISSIQCTAFFSPALHTESVRAVGAAVADDASDDSMPVVVVSAYRRSWMML